MIKLSRFTNVEGSILKNSFEKAAWARSALVCGIDEVGRGCLAGPLVTAAVILPQGKAPRILKDSKVMSLEERLEANQWITKNCLYGYGIVNHRVIDTHNIWHATLIAMKKAVINLLSTAPQLPEAIVVDAMPLNLADTPYASIPVYYFPFGESRSSSIAAASIIAKVKRDELMGKLDSYFPGYEWKSNKGYRTPVHKKMVHELSHSIIHRKSYLNDLIDSHLDERDDQQTIF